MEMDDSDHMALPGRKESNHKVVPSEEKMVGSEDENSPCSKERRKDVKYSNIQPVWRFVLLWLFTLGFYQIYWFYRNWDQLKEHKSLDWSPRWRTVFLFVPVANIILILQTFQDISYFARDAGVVKNYSPAIVFFSFLILNMFNFLPESDWMSWIGLLAVFPLAIVQNTMNAYWKMELPSLPTKNKFSTAEMLVLAIGGIFWAYIILGIFVLLWLFGE